MLMASSKVIASGSSPNSDLPPTYSINIHSDQAIMGFGSMNVDEIFQNIYPDSAAGDGGISSVEGVGRNGNERRTVEEVWRDIVQGGGGREPAMTLEDFLAKAGAVNEEDVRVPAMRSLGLGVMMSMHNVIGGELRGKRKVAVEEDKATQQKQRRMIKNRESAARSRERKQAYTVELESLVAQLEEENARLVREEVQLHRERLKQLMENIIPVGEKRRPPSPRNLRRMRSI